MAISLGSMVKMVGIGVDTYLGSSGRVTVINGGTNQTITVQITKAGPRFGETGYCVGNIINFYPRNLEIINRKDRGEAMKAEAVEIAAKAATMMDEANNLMLYETDEEAVAALIVDAISLEGDRDDRIKKLAATLKGRIATDMV